MIYLLHPNEDTSIGMTSIGRKWLTGHAVPFLNNNSASYKLVLQNGYLPIHLSVCGTDVASVLSPNIFPIPLARLSHPFTLRRVGGHALNGSGGGGDGGGGFIGDVYWKIYSNIFN